MATAHLIPEQQDQLISVEEYLRTSYRPDCDYIDGRVDERNLGEFDHAELQTALAFLFRLNAQVWNVRAVVECRYQVKPTRFRIPDIAVLRAGQKVDRIIREAPLLCIEVLSPEDTWKRLEARIDDYFEHGVQHVWVFDPDTRTAFRYEANGSRFRIDSDVLGIPGTPIEIHLKQLFASLDQ